MTCLDLPTIISSLIWTALAAFLLALTLRQARRPLQRAIPSPRDTLLPKISAQQAAALPYPPHLMPGARDVATPYGVMRVYEWGPETGDKVLFIHGDTTPAPMFSPIAHDLVKRGCRVMLFDLWGRGYSDSPLGVPHDSKLFGMQILFAAASSSLSWTGADSGGFSIVGFSLGGGIAMAFAADFPYLINSMVLLAPAGLIRRLPDDYKSCFLRYPSMLPSSYLKKLVGKAIGLPVPTLPTGLNDIQTASQKSQETKEVGKEDLDIPGIVRWQFDHHKGFIHSFISTVRHGPIQHQHSDWTRVCSIITGDKSQMPPSSHSSKLFNSKILVILGDSDSVIQAEEVSADLLDLFGDPKYVQIKKVAGGHGFPVPSCDEVSKHISEFCGFENSRWRPIYKIARGTRSVSGKGWNPNLS